MSISVRILNELLQRLSADLERDQMLGLCLDAALVISGADRGAIHLVDEKTGALDLAVHKGLSPGFAEALSYCAPESPQALIALEARPFYKVFRTFDYENGDQEHSAALYTVATVPIRHRGCTTAILSLLSGDAGEIPMERRFDLETVAAVIGSVLYRFELEETNAKLDEQLRHSQKLEALGTLAGGVAHDMNNVLGGIMGLATLLREETNPKDVRYQDIEKILEASRRGSTLTRNLLDFARKGKQGKKGISLNRVVQQVEQLLERTFLKKVVIKTRLDEALARVEGDSGQLTHALMNLCLNAVDAMEGEGTLVISTANKLLNDVSALPYPNMRPGLYAVLEVADSGRGMDPMTLDHVFEPFFTTKEPGQGTGLGLPMVYNTVRNHNGTISIESELGKGTVVRILLPAFETDAPQAAAGQDFDYKAQGGIGTILLVDDEEIIRSTGRRLLEKLGYTVILAENGRVALEIFEDRHEEIDLVILDMAMPVLDGAACLSRLKEIDAGVRVLISSGFRGKKTEKLFGTQGIDFLAKPFDIEQLADAVAKSLLPGEPS